jgi:ABC-type transport system involved in multi-copper enzyme maturation permease subunit
MSPTAVIARQHLRLLSRSQTFLLMLVVLLGMTALSGFIGWASHSTILRVYNDTVKTLTAAGKPAPPNPFAYKPRLSLLNNMTIYVPLIGALLAILIGNMSITGDRQAGVTRVIFSRPVLRSSYFWGKVAGSAVAGAVIMAACLLLSVIGLTLINHGLPTASELVRLTLFYALSGLYLLLFALIGIVAALLTRSHSLGLFAAVAVWALITFATPQFTSGLRPVASLNPVTDPASVSHSRFFRATSKAKPLAVNEQYKALSTRLLSQGNDVVRAGWGATAAQLAPIVFFVLLLGGWAHWLIDRRDFSEETARD